MVKPVIAERGGAAAGDDARNGERAASVRWALAGLSLCVLLPSLGISVANVALPTLADAFGAPFQDVQWIVLSYLLAITSLIVGAGRLGDLAGRRRLLLGGIALFTLASALCGAAPTLWLLVAARAAQGVGAAVMMALAMALVAGTVPASRVGGAMGLLGTMSAVGTALGPSLGGGLIAGFGWRAIFLAGLPLGLLAFALARRHLPADRREDRDGTTGGTADGTARGRAGFDGLGTLLLALTLAAYALAMTMGRGAFGPLTLALLLAAACGAGLFLRVEANAASPLIRPAMLRDPALGRGLAANALVSTVMMATLVVGPFHLSHALGLDTGPAGLALSAGPLAAALAGVPAGRLTDRFGARRMTVAGLAGMAAGTVLLSGLPAALGAALGVAGYLAPLVVVTIGYALFQTANNTAVMTGVRPDQRGLTSGLLNLARNLGLVTGASAMGAVFAAAAGDVATAGAEAVASGTRATFAVAAGLIAAALAVTVAGRRARPGQTADGA
ncbi:MFS family permease [Azospirillum agricola]|uniref:MFS transporter n=1 Tax=Azospirillum agricola TaxID=1720247 RepID=UPI001AE9AF5D|nr:MFS transporter [Azospirillum agricola]MBP2229544.1 MFS family permease [Azospirillum agricola]